MSSATDGGTERIADCEPGQTDEAAENREDKRIEDKDVEEPAAKPKSIKEMMAMRRVGKPMSKQSGLAAKKPKRAKPSATDDEAAEAEQPSMPTMNGPQVKFDPKTGDIIIDEGTLTHFSQNPSAGGFGRFGDLVVEGGSTTTSASYTSRVPSERWTPEETRQFYQGVA
jgi:hypothetical protein